MKSTQPANSNAILGEFSNKSALSRLSAKLAPIFRDIIKKENLGDEMMDQYANVYLSLAAWIAEKHTNKPIVIGINGAQGSGKSTLSKILKALLLEGFAKSIVHLSIDDLYYSREKRKKLGESIHPLLKVRGVPGTHDVEKGINILNKLAKEQVRDGIFLPVFDKANDDLLPESEWQKIDAPVDIILFEGWCVGSKGQNADDLLRDVNDLEKYEDKDRTWRNYVNQQLEGPYQEFFKYIDYLIMLQVPDMESVYEWRLLQENKLKEQCANSGHIPDKIMSEKQIKRFIMHYERITRHNLEEMPSRADALLKISKSHQITMIKEK